MTHGYFRVRAAEWFATHGGRSENAAELAQWAEAAWGGQDSRVGVVVTERGHIVAHTRHLPGGPSVPGATYVTESEFEEVRNLEIGLALGSLRRLTGEGVLPVRYSEVCTGAVHTRWNAEESAWNAEEE
jgi:hypothetical protein